MKLPSFDYACPETVTDAVALLAAHPGDAKVIAGGQSLVPMLAFRVAAPSLIVDLRKLRELKQITIDDNGVTLGAMVRWREVLDHPRLREAQPLLAAGVAHIGHYQIRNRGTVGGSLAHADPAAELSCIAVTCAAEVAALGRAGRRMIAAADFFRGALLTALQPDEIIIEIRFPVWSAHRRFGFREFARRRGDFALAAAAVAFDAAAGRFAGARIGAIGIADRPVRLATAERALEGRPIGEDAIVAAAAAASTAATAAGDIHASGAYRKVLIGVMVERALRDAVNRGPG